MSHGIAGHQPIVVGTHASNIQKTDRGWTIIRTNISISLSLFNKRCTPKAIWFYVNSYMCTVTVLYLRLQESRKYLCPGMKINS